MIGWVVGLALAAGVACVLLAAGLAIWGGTRMSTQTVERGIVGALVAAVVLFLTAAAVALIDTKVADAKSGSKSGKTTSTGPVRTYPLGGSDIPSFKGRYRRFARPLPKELCLVNYHDSDKEVDADGGRTLKFWTSCSYSDKKLRDVTDVHQNLALPPDFGERNARAIACVPKRAILHYLLGKVAPQWSTQEDRLYLGRGVQYRVIAFDERWIRETQPVDGPPARIARIGTSVCS